MDIRPFRLCPPYQIHAFPCADMLDVHAGSGLHCQSDVPLYQADLRLPVRPRQPHCRRRFSRVHAAFLNISRIFLVKADGYTKFFTFFHRPFHKFLIHQRFPVVRKTYSPRLPQSLHICQFLPFQILRHRTAGIYVDQRILPLFQHITQRIRPVCRRFRVRHHHNAGKPAGCRCCCPCQDILLFCKSRISEVYMHIHQPRRHNIPFRINRLDFMPRKLSEFFRSFQTFPYS